MCPCASCRLRSPAYDRAVDTPAGCVRDDRDRALRPALRVRLVRGVAALVGRGSRRVLAGGVGLLRAAPADAARAGARVTGDARRAVVPANAAQLRRAP